MKKINYKVLDSFKRVSASFRRFVNFEDDNLRNYAYCYDVNFKLLDSRYQFTAFKRNTSTKWKDVLFDYTSMINVCISNNYSQSAIADIFGMTPSNNAKVWLIEDYSAETIQEIIDKNIAAFNTLQNYINDLQLIKDLRLDE